jgi:hypothetical protein
MRTNPNLSIILDYINKLNVNLQRAGILSYQLGMLNIFLSVLLVFFSYQTIQINNEITLQGVTFELNFSNQVFLLILSTLISITYTLASGMGAHSRSLREHIRRLYGEIGFIDRSMVESPNPLESPHIIGHIFDFNRLNDKNKLHKLYFLYRLLILGVIVLLPLIAQVWSTYIQWIFSQHNVNTIYFNLPLIGITLIEITIYLCTPFTKYK